MRERLTWFLMGAATAGVIFTLVAWRADPSPTVASASDPRSRDLVARVDSVDQRLVALEARMSTAASVHDRPAPAADTLPLEAPATSAQQRAAETGGAIVDRAIASGRWTRRDAVELSSTADLRGEDELELRRQLAVAINDDRVKVEPGAEFN